MVRFDRRLEEQEYYARVEASIPLTIHTYDLQKTPPQHHVHLCKSHYGKQATDHFAKQLHLVQQYHVSQPSLLSNTIIYTVTEHSTQNQRILTCPLPPHTPGNTSPIQLTSSFLLECGIFRCSCNSDISLGVPCRHILRMLQEHSISFLHRMPYFHPRWKINTSPPQNMLKRIFVGQRKLGQSVLADESDGEDGDGGAAEADTNEVADMQEASEDDLQLDFREEAKCKTTAERLADMTAICDSFAQTLVSVSFV